MTRVWRRVVGGLAAAMVAWLALAPVASAGVCADEVAVAIAAGLESVQPPSDPMADPCGDGCLVCAHGGCHHLVGVAAAPAGEAGAAFAQPQRHGVIGPPALRPGPLFRLKRPPRA